MAASALEPDNQPPSEGHASSHAPAAPVSLVQLFIESFFVLGRYMIIIYPVFFYLILSRILFPSSGEPDFTRWTWWVVLIGLTAIFYIFKAGWNLMMYNAVKEWLTPPPAQPAPGEAPTVASGFNFGLLKDFIPGMGEFGLPFLLGAILMFVLTSVPVVVLVWLGVSLIGIPQFLVSLQEKTNITPAEVQTILDSLTALERWQLDQWKWIALAMLLVLFVINGLTLFWQQFIIIKQCNAFQAFIYSMRHAVRHPVKTFVILFYFGFFSLLFTLLANMGSVLGFFGNFLFILSMVFFGLFMYLYLLRLDVPQES